ncbi:MAG: cytochrome c [Deltaproteobacteria bacterium]|jgi:mono/diheme cytochrome c family protein|nr:cytochrome c [Deltaproteobacteria bacterium]
MRGFLYSSLVMALMAYACDDPPAAAPPKAPPPAPPPPAAPAPGGDLADGRRFYLMACANCHGPDGTGAMMRQMMPKIGDLTSAELHNRMSDEDIFNLATNGRDKMPAFKDSLKPEQIRKVVQHVRTLKR